MKSETAKRCLLPIFIVLGGVCLLFLGSKLDPPPVAMAQPQTGAESGIIVVPIQIERDSYGLAMVDTIGQTLWVYEISSPGPAYNRLRLLAARSWRYDKLLQQYNTAEPKPEQVKLLLENLGQPPKGQSKEKQKGSDTSILEMAVPDDKDSSG